MTLFSLNDLMAAESLLSQERYEDALPVFQGMCKDCDDYAITHWQGDDHVQYFSFNSLVERLIYRRVENDKRTLHAIDVPVDRAYADLSFCYIMLGQDDQAMMALKKAIRYNPMNCVARLSLAELMRAHNEADEWLGLSYSVLERAVNPLHLARAFANFATSFMLQMKLSTAAAAVKVARIAIDGESLPQLDLVEQGLAAAEAQLPGDMDLELAKKLLEEGGLPDGPNLEVAVTILIAADEANKRGQIEEAVELVQMCNALCGEDATMTLAHMVMDCADGEFARDDQDETIRQDTIEVLEQLHHEQ